MLIRAVNYLKHTLKLYIHSIVELYISIINVKCIFILYVIIVFFNHINNVIVVQSISYNQGRIA